MKYKDCAKNKENNMHVRTTDNISAPDKQEWLTGREPTENSC
ncbi:hypothetical protein BN132_2555 [Cronobacter turicensis 564]|nr:hypothetical protein BN132_2555 [Cronobacter turicensis 564]